MGYYGHGSSLFVIVILVGFVLRMAMSRRSRPTGGGPLGRGGGRPLPPPPRQPADIDARSTTTEEHAAPAEHSTFGRSGIPAGWMPDPSGKHQQRYWSGTAWTEHVVTDGVPGTDPLPERH